MTYCSSRTETELWIHCIEHCECADSWGIICHQPWLHKEPPKCSWLRWIREQHCTQKHNHKVACRQFFQFYLVYKCTCVCLPRSVLVSSIAVIKRCQVYVIGHCRGLWRARVVWSQCWAGSCGWAFWTAPHNTTYSCQEEDHWKSWYSHCPPG